MHLLGVGFGDPAQMFLDLYILIIEPNHHWPQFGQGVHFMIGELVLFVWVLFLSHNQGSIQVGVVLPIGSTVHIHK
jgi:hypothetical protein